MSESLRPAIAGGERSRRYLPEHLAKDGRRRAVFLPGRGAATSANTRTAAHFPFQARRPAKYVNGAPASEAKVPRGRPPYAKPLQRKELSQAWGQCRKPLRRRFISVAGQAFGRFTACEDAK